MVRGVFFDLDDTLIVNRARQRASLQVAWEEVFGTCPAVEIDLLGRTLRSVYDATFGYGTAGYAELAHIDPIELARRTATKVVEHRGFPRPEDAERFCHAWVAAERSALAVLPGTVPTLAALRGAGLQLGLITNGPSAVQRTKLAIPALADAFDVVVIDCEFGHPKPDRRIFDHAAGAAGLSPVDLCFVGDSLSADIAGARGAGWTAVWYNPSDAPLPPGTPPPQFTIGALADLLALGPLGEVIGRGPL